MERNNSTHYINVAINLSDRKDCTMGKYWDPSNYSIEDQLLETINGRDVATSGNDVLKGHSNGDVSIFWPSSSENGHGHAVVHSDGTWEIAHD